tara:strand:- start:3 stop:1205 length:1203 start_codon:yes stop_codon:yes gene_type:complete
MAPFLILGMLVSGLISVFIDNSIIFKHIGSKNFVSIFKATLMGIPLPLCSCGVIPVAATLKDSGASKGATTSFLVSTPQTGVDSIFLTYGMLGPVFALFRPLAAFISGLFCGLAVNSIDDEMHHHSYDENYIKKEKGNLIQTIKSGIQYGFVTMPADIVVPMFQGLFIAAAISLFLPPEFLASFINSDSFFMYLIMLVVSLPFYVCATASIPIAVALFSKGVSAGAIFVFLMAGPATNASSIAVIKNIMGKKILFFYLALISFSAVFFGLVFDFFFEINMGDILRNSHHHHHNEGFFSMITMLFFIVIMANAYKSKFQNTVDNLSKINSNSKITTQTISFNVKGMTCSHCKESVESAIKSFDDALDTSIDLSTGKVIIVGTKLNEKVIKQKIENKGFSIA